MINSPVLGLPVPEDGDDNDVAGNFEQYTARLEQVLGIEVLTQAQINDLTTSQKPMGRFVWNTTTGRLQRSTGTGFEDYRDPDALPKSGGAMTGPVAMGGSKVTGLGDGTAAGDAVNLGQLQAAASVGGVGSAMLSAEPIEVMVTTGTSPTGRWSVVAVPLGMWAGRVRVVSTMGTTATIRVTETELPPGPTPGTPQPLFFWQAVAY